MSVFAPRLARSVRGTLFGLLLLGPAGAGAQEPAPVPSPLRLIASGGRGCTMTALLLPAVQKVRAAAEHKEVDTRRISAPTRRAYAEFWSGLSARERAALESRLRSLAERAGRGGEPLTCIGVGYIDPHGNFVCIGVLID